MLTRYFTLIQNLAHFLCIRSAHYHTKNSLSFGQVNMLLHKRNQGTIPLIAQTPPPRSDCAIDGAKINAMA